MGLKLVFPIDLNVLLISDNFPGIIIAELEYELDVETTFF